MKRLRNAILVQLVDGALGDEQAKAIRTLARDGVSLSAACRRVLLREVGRADLDAPVVARVPAPCNAFRPSTMRPDVCETCTRRLVDHDM